MLTAHDARVQAEQLAVLCEIRDELKKLTAQSEPKPSLATRIGLVKPTKKRS